MKTVFTSLNPVHRFVLGAVLRFLALGAAIFAIAGTTNYYLGWYFLLISGFFLLVGLVIFNRRINFLLAPAKLQTDAHSPDKKIRISIQILVILTLIIAVIDGGRMNWSPEIPAIVFIIATVLYTVGFAVLFWAAAVNNYFTPGVRIQIDQGQTVVAAGPYQIVRHPGYAAVIGILFSMPLLLGSFIALIPAGLVIWIFVSRTRQEDDFLKRGLPGYTSYAQRVPYRLIPRLW